MFDDFFDDEFKVASKKKIPYNESQMMRSNLDEQRVSQMNMFDDGASKRTIKLPPPSQRRQSYTNEENKRQINQNDELKSNLTRQPLLDNESKEIKKSQKQIQLPPDDQRRQTYQRKHNHKPQFQQIDEQSISQDDKISFSKALENSTTLDYQIVANFKLGDGEFIPEDFKFKQKQNPVDELNDDEYMNYLESFNLNENIQQNEPGEENECCTNCIVDCCSYFIQIVIMFPLIVVATVIAIALGIIAVAVALPFIVVILVIALVLSIIALFIRGCVKLVKFTVDHSDECVENFTYYFCYISNTFLAMFLIYNEGEARPLLGKTIIGLLIFNQIVKLLYWRHLYEEWNADLDTKKPDEESKRKKWIFLAICLNLDSPYWLSYIKKSNYKMSYDEAYEIYTQEQIKKQQQDNKIIDEDQIENDNDNNENYENVQDKKDSDIAYFYYISKSLEVFIIHTPILIIALYIFSFGIVRTSMLDFQFITCNPILLDILLYDFNIDRYDCLFNKLLINVIIFNFIITLYYMLKVNFFGLGKKQNFLWLLIRGSELWTKATMLAIILCLFETNGYIHFFYSTFALLMFCSIFYYITIINSDDEDSASWYITVPYSITKVFGVFSFNEEQYNFRNKYDPPEEIEQKQKKDEGKEDQKEIKQDKEQQPKDIDTQQQKSEDKNIKKEGENLNDQEIKIEGDGQDEQKINQEIEKQSIPQQQIVKSLKTGSQIQQQQGDGTQKQQSINQSNLQQDQQNKSLIIIDEYLEEKKTKQKNELYYVFDLYAQPRICKLNISNDEQFLNFNFFLSNTKITYAFNTFFVLQIISLSQYLDQSQIHNIFEKNLWFPISIILTLIISSTYYFICLYRIMKAEIGDDPEEVDDYKKQVDELDLEDQDSDDQEAKQTEKTEENQQDNSDGGNEDFQNVQNDDIEQNRSKQQ